MVTVSVRRVGRGVLPVEIDELDDDPPPPQAARTPLSNRASPFLFIIHPYNFRAMLAQTSRLQHMSLMCPWRIHRLMNC